MSTNTDKLHEANVIDKEKLNDDHKKSIESLSNEEVEQVISISKKLGDIPHTTGAPF
ncbi:MULTISPECIES: hypothetical protein [unclassified Colwellia]|jgi:hypothetical protein|uniref:hypothetical protein n=1 Tax=unclassified Colwellia TaxID=196834 RepID=UPI0015F55BA7|nr:MULTISPECIES: hypothetical protein [unclassified Colwellia]MBA6232543.1 hypothetical protein [Colwellia sp. MB02u-7]MBA6235316.1 hypothetical protein [Colwellia sp. MB02u-11]MBA6257861.1 hypothetical protein [Colwellia sp. MB3u-28]MBA6258458.1 hypothetical protein [Colwellia sp. MB3u-41]MBA6262519.1 hypothetical protein [Colwellia sp. Bg11-12]